MKKRIIPSILLKNGTSTSLSNKFQPWRTTGTLAQQLKLHISREADELILLNPFSSLASNPRITQLINKEVDIPITYSGNINTVEDAENCIKSGFEKVYVSRLFHRDPEEINRISNVLGRQSIGISFEYKWICLNEDIFPVIWDFENDSATDISILTALSRASDLGVGEILLYNVDRDGSLSGLDMKILSYLEQSSIELPILLAGGAGSETHFADVLKHPLISGVVAGSVFALSQCTPSTVRKYCKSLEISMRNL